MTAARPTVQLGTVVVCGGGCYGSYYVRQLARAHRVGALTVREVLVVDHDAACRVARAQAETTDYEGLPLRIVSERWEPFFARWFDDVLAHPDDHVEDAVVPSPLMPHLLADWTEARLRVLRPDAQVSRVPLPVTPDTPWQREGAGPTHYTSFATWMCPINCIEPATCPETRGPRDWTMPAAVQRTARLAADAGQAFDHVATFHTRHVVYGVGMFSLEALPPLDAALRATSSAHPWRVLVASVSHCHGALAAIDVTAPQSGSTSSSGSSS